MGQQSLMTVLEPTPLHRSRRFFPTRPLSLTSMQAALSLVESSCVPVANDEGTAVGSYTLSL